MLGNQGRRLLHFGVFTPYPRKQAEIQTWISWHPFVSPTSARPLCWELWCDFKTNQTWCSQQRQSCFHVLIYIPSELRNPKIGFLQEAQNHSTSHLEQTAKNGGIERTRMTFASHPSEFVSRVVDLAAPPPPAQWWRRPPRVLPVTPAFLPVTDCQRSCQDHECGTPTPGAWTAPARESGINRVWGERENMSLEGEEKDDTPKEAF